MTELGTRTKAVVTTAWSEKKARPLLKRWRTAFGVRTADTTGLVQTSSGESIAAPPEHSLAAQQRLLTTSQPHLYTSSMRRQPPQLEAIAEHLNIRTTHNHATNSSLYSFSLFLLRTTQHTKQAHYKPKFHLARHASTRHDTFDVSSQCILAVSSLSNSTARHTGHDELDSFDTPSATDATRNFVV